MPDSLEHRFKHHPPTGDKGERHQQVRAACFATAEAITSLVPPSREQSLALTKLEEAMMWANAGIARS
jgi:hypothetical protein